jgi:hypothetical protein
MPGADNFWVRDMVSFIDEQPQQRAQVLVGCIEEIERPKMRDDVIGPSSNSLPEDLTALGGHIC